MKTLLFALFAGLSLAAPSAAPQAREARPGILLLAHGGAPAWNDNVLAIARDLDRAHPTEVAFGMATRANIQAAADKLAARGATEIVAVPLFVSSHSSVVRSTEYLLGLRPDAPADLARFAKMSHGAHGNGHGAPAGDHAGHGAATASDLGTTPIVTTLPVRMTEALNRHALLGAIVADRARAISTAPACEAVILVAHGPVPDDDNALWLADLRALAAHVTGYASVDILSLRDDAPAPVRDAATAQLRAKVTAARGQGRDVVIVPVLLSYGGIERGLKARLEGLDYRLPAQGIAPDARLAEWVQAVSGLAATSERQLLITPAQLAARIADPNLVLLHVGEKDGYDRAHITGARFVDYRDYRNGLHTSGDLTLQMLPANTLHERLAALGISDGSRVVVYFADGWITPATRVMLTLDYAGLDDVALLDGGMDAWTRAGQTVTAAVTPERAGTLSPLKLRPVVVDADNVQASLGRAGVAIVDARTTNFYEGTQTGGRPDARHKTGHIQGARSVPFSTLFNEDGSVKPVAELRAIFDAAGVKPGDTVIAYCHIGQQATGVAFAARLLGRKVVLYDGSFEDWSRRDLPVEAGPARR